MSRKPKSKRINVNVKERWRQIVKSVAKNEAPIAMLNCVIVNLIDGTAVEVDIQELLKSGIDADDVKDMLNARLERMDHLIKDVDFMIDINKVATTVQPVTDDILKHFK